MKEQVLCPSCLAEEVLEEAGYCSLGKEGRHRCKRNKEHKGFPATFEGQFVFASELVVLADFMKVPVNALPPPGLGEGNDAL